MRRTSRSVFLAVFVLAVAVGVVSGTAPASAQALPPASTAEAQFLALLNTSRTGAGLAPLTRDPGVDNVARAWSGHMAAVYAVTGDPVIKPNAPNDCNQSSLCHRPDLVAAIAAVEPNWQLIGENIGFGYSIQSLHDSLMASAGHRANILGNYNRVGIGVVVQGTHLWVTFDFLKGPAIGGGGGTGVDYAVPVADPGGPPVVPLASRTRYNPVSPVRVLDTRRGLGGYAGVLYAGSTLRMRMAGVAGVPGGAGGVALNLTAAAPTGRGFLTAYPCGQGRPDASNLNVAPGVTRANQTVVALDGTGDLCIFSSVTTHVIADLAGWYGSSGGAFKAVTPLRLIDTRNNYGVLRDLGVPLAGRVPGDATSVTLNVTVTSPQAAGFATVYPCGQPIPDASNLNFRAGETVPNLVTVKIGAGMGVCVHSTANTHMIVDLAGSYGSSGTTLTTSVPDRFLDTRTGTGGWLGALGNGQEVQVPIGGANGVPAGATAAVLNVTVTAAQAPGFLVAYPCDAPVPTASNLNFVTGDTVPNLVVVRLAGNGKVCIKSSTRTYVLADLAGWFTS